MTLEDALAELRTAAQSCGAWPQMRELQAQVEQGFADTLLRFGSKCWDRGYDAARERYNWQGEKPR